MGAGRGMQGHAEVHSNIELTISSSTDECGRAKPQAGGLFATAAMRGAPELHGWTSVAQRAVRVARCACTWLCIRYRLV